MKKKKKKYNIDFLNKTITNIDSLLKSNLFIEFSKLVNGFNLIQVMKTALVNALNTRSSDNIFARINAQVKNFAISFLKKFTAIIRAV